MGHVMRGNALGKIFKVEKQLGRGDVFEVISTFPDGQVQIHTFHHEDCDGLGALLKLSREWNPTPLELPAFKMPLSKGSVWGGLSGLWTDLKPHQTRWKSIKMAASYTPEHLARRVLSQNATEAIVACASKQGVNLNALLLWVVNKVVAEVLLHPEQEHCHWLLPVNTRAQGNTQSTANHTSSIGLHFERSTSLVEVFEIYKRALNPWHALGQEKLTEFLAALSEKHLLALARLRGEKNSWIGSFSNLGRWEFPDRRDESCWPSHISIAPPAGTPCFPVGVGIITWQGRMSISLRLHAALCQSSVQMPDMILDGVISTLEKISGLPLNNIAREIPKKETISQFEINQDTILSQEHNALCNTDNCASHSK
jgi:hypothetical protein